MGVIKIIYKRKQILFANNYKRILPESEKNLLYSSRSIIIEKFKIGNFYLCEKNPIDSKKEKENIHEAFIGIFCVNEILKS